MSKNPSTIDGAMRYISSLMEEIFRNKITDETELTSPLECTNFNITTSSGAVGGGFESLFSFLTLDAIA